MTAVVRTHLVVGVRGWAVFLGCDGEDPQLVAFFAGASSERTALEFVAATKDPDSPIEWGIFRAELTDTGLFSAADYRVSSFDELTEAVRWEMRA